MNNENKPIENELAVRKILELNYPSFPCVVTPTLDIAESAESSCNDAIPEMLKQYRQWVVWKYEGRADDNVTKVPYQINGQRASVSNPDDWVDFKMALENSSQYEGIGFVFTESDPFIGIDLDGCRNPENGEIADWAKKWINNLSSYTEISPSGTGVKIILKGRNPNQSGLRVKLDMPWISKKAPAVENYDHGRYFTITGHHLEGTPLDVSDQQEKIDQFIDYFYTPKKNLNTCNSSNIQNSQIYDQDREEIIERARMYLQTIPPAISGQGGHNTTFYAACKTVVGFGLTEKGALLVLGEWNKKCIPPWTEDELLHKIRDAMKKVDEQGKGYLVQEPISRPIVEWRDPCEPDLVLPPVSPFDTDRLLPDPIKDYCPDIAERMQVPVDFPAVGLIVTIAGAINRRALVQPKPVDNMWVETLNQWGGIIAPPGFKKSPVIDEVTRPLSCLEFESRKRYEGQKKEYDRLLSERNRESKELKRKVKNQDDDNNESPSLFQVPIEEPMLSRFITTDATCEALHKILSENPMGLLVSCDELTGWMANFEKKGREADRAFFLTCWNGKTGHTFDRIGRGSIYVPHCCISLLGAIQPAKLKQYLQDITKNRIDEDGLIQRIQLLVWPDTNKNWEWVDREPDMRSMQYIGNLIRNIVDQNETITYMFSPNAQEKFKLWLSDLEANIRSDDTLPIMSSHMSKYRKTMPSLAALFQIVENGNKTNKISLANTERAINWMKYLRSHAERTYSCMGQRNTNSAKTLLEKIRSGNLSQDGGTIKVRDIYNSGWKGLDNLEKAKGALEILEKSGWVQAYKPNESKQPGRPSETYHIHPQLIRT